MAPEAPEMPTTILLVMSFGWRSGSCPGGGGARARAPSPQPPPAARCPVVRRRGAPGHPRIARDPRSPVPPAAHWPIAVSGRVSLGSFLGSPMPHTHVATAIAKQCVDLAIVRDSADDLSHEQDVISGRSLVAHVAPEHRQAALDRRCGEARLFDSRDLQRGEL